jgi:hypothetical protein
MTELLEEEPDSRSGWEQRRESEGLVHTPHFLFVQDGGLEEPGGPERRNRPSDNEGQRKCDL